VLAGALMIAAAVLRLGRFTRFVPHSMKIGFLTGLWPRSPSPPQWSLEVAGKQAVASVNRHRGSSLTLTG